MQAQASALIDKYLTVVNKTGGRDKFAKWMYYFVRVLAYPVSDFPTIRQKLDSTMNTGEFLKRMALMEGDISNARRVFRFFAFVEGYLGVYSYCTSDKSSKLSVKGLLELLSNISGSLSLINDNLYFLSKFKLLSSQPLQSLFQFSSPQPFLRRTLMYILDVFKFALNNERCVPFALWAGRLWFTSAFAERLNDLRELWLQHQRIQQTKKELYTACNSDNGCCCSAAGDDTSQVPIAGGSATSCSKQLCSSCATKREKLDLAIQKFKRQRNNTFRLVLIFIGDAIAWYSENKPLIIISGFLAASLNVCNQFL